MNNQRNFQQQQSQPQRVVGGGGNTFQQGNNFQQQAPTQQQQQQRLMVSSLLNQVTQGAGGFVAGGTASLLSQGMGNQSMGNQTLGLQQQQQLLQQKSQFAQMQTSGMPQQQMQGNRLLGLQQQAQQQGATGGGINPNMVAMARLSNLSSMLASANSGNAMNNMNQGGNFNAMAKGNMGVTNANNNNNDANEWDQFFSQNSGPSNMVSNNQAQQQQSNLQALRNNMNQNQMQNSFSNNQSFGNMQNQQSMGMGSLQGQVLPSRNLQSLLQAQQNNAGNSIYDPTSPGLDSMYGAAGGGRGGGSQMAMQNPMNAVGTTLRMLQQQQNQGNGGGSGASFLPNDVRFQNLQQQQPQNDYDDMMSTGSGGGMRSRNTGAYGQQMQSPSGGGRMGSGSSGFHGGSTGGSSRFSKSSAPSARTSKPYYFHDLPPMTGPVNPNRKNSKWSRTFEDPLAFPAPFVGVKTSKVFALANTASSGGFSSKAPASAFSSHPSRSSYGDSEFSSAVSSRLSQAMDARAVRRLQSSTAVTSTRSTRRKRDRSNSPSYERERSRSTSPAGDHSARRASAPTTATGESSYQRIPKRVLRPASPARGTTTTAATTSGASSGGRSRRFDVSALTLKELAQTLHLNIVSKNLLSLDAIELALRFPQLYIPADYIEMKIDWNDLLDAFHHEFFYELSASVPIVIENNPSILIYREIDGMEEETQQLEQEQPVPSDEGQKEEGESTSEAPIASNAVVPVKDDLANLRRTFHSDIQRSPQFSYLSALTCNNSVVGFAMSDEDHVQQPYMDKFCYENKLVKFNVRVLVGCGMKEDGDVFDNQFFRKMRILCGRKKGVATLLGTSYSQELDGGNPLADRSCLYNTARRALYAQTLLDIGTDAASHMIKLAEVCYHRPKEEIGGKEYPEQEEISVLFFYALQPSYLHGLGEETFDREWNMFTRRLLGTLPGPMLSKNVDQNEEDFHMHLHDIQDLDNRVNDTLTQRASKSTPAETSTAASGDADGTSSNVATDGAATNGEEVAKTGAFSFRDVKPLEHQKPEMPTVLLAPMPLPYETRDIPVHKQDGLSLRLVPISSILSYSQDDRNERLFEVSLAAELFQSYIVLAHANLLADFVLSDHDDLSYLATARVLQVVKHFRDKSAKKITSAAPAAESSSTTIPSPSASSTPSKTEVKTEPTAAPADESATIVAEALEEAEETKPIAESDGQEEVVDGNGTQAAESKENEEDGNTDDFSVSAEEAALWKKKFIGACRWFDVNQDRYLKQETLLLILYTSHRNITRADAVAVSEELCKDDKFFYELFL